VGAQTDFDTYKAAINSSQLHALENACFGLLGQLALLGATALGVRIGWALFRTGPLSRFRIIWIITGQLGMNGHRRDVVCRILTAISHPAAVGGTLYLAPSIGWTIFLKTRGQL